MRLNFLGRTSAWKTGPCRKTTTLDAPRRAFSTPGRPPKPLDKKRKWRVAQLTAAGGTLTASAAFFSDEIKHGYNAAERSARVLSTLAVCVNEYVVSSIARHAIADPTVAAIARLSKFVSMIMMKKH